MSDVYEIAFQIPGLPATTNANGRKHWALKAKEARHWKKEVAAAIGYNKPSKPLPRASLTLTRASSVAPDFDGLVSSFKHVIDALRECGIISEDKLVNIGAPKYLWEPAPRGKGYIRVQVEELKEGENGNLPPRPSPHR